MGEDIMNKNFYSELSITDPINGKELDIIEKTSHHEELTPQTVMFDKSPFKDLSPLEYLHSTSHSLSEEIISPNNLSQIKQLAAIFNKGITSFFGFEIRLGSSEANSDYLFAVSSKNGERESLMKFFEHEMPDHLKNLSEWRNLHNFTMKWSDPTSEINNNVLGLWLEFDTAHLTDNSNIPNIFLQIKKTRIDSEEDEHKFKWITQKALPLLTGATLPKNIEENLINAIKKLPEGTALIHVGTMLSRQIKGVRIVINRIKPDQIIPYLKSIGWKDETNKLIQIINEIDKYVSRLVLHINIGETVDPKIGLECSFAEDRYHLETEWEKFFDYLENKGLCIQEKRKALLDFLGIEQEHNDYEFNFTTYMVAPKIKHSNYTSALVRYLSHIKIVYKPDYPLEAKAYLGVRLFGMEL